VVEKCDLYENVISNVCAVDTDHYLELYLQTGENEKKTLIYGYVYSNSKQGNHNGGRFDKEILEVGGGE
jgi:hypothetical protein